MLPAYSLHITTRGYLCLVQLHEMVDNTATSKFDARLNWYRWAWLHGDGSGGDRQSVTST
jgi:hypothetical protein